jgi:hypothetical protein
LSEWVRKVDCGVLGQYDYDAYAAIDGDIVTAETQTDEEIVREMGSKDEKKQKNRKKKRRRRKKKKLSCQFPL